MIWDFGNRIRGFAGYTPQLIALQPSPPPSSTEPHNGQGAESGLTQKQAVGRLLKVLSRAGTPMGKGQAH